MSIQALRYTRTICLVVVLMSVFPRVATAQFDTPLATSVRERIAGESIDLDAPAGADNINDATDVNKGEASFYHTK